MDGNPYKNTLWAGSAAGFLLGLVMFAVEPAFVLGPILIGAAFAWFTFWIVVQALTWTPESRDRR